MFCPSFLNVLCLADINTTVIALQGIYKPLAGPRRRQVVRVLRHELAGKGLFEDGLAEEVGVGKGGVDGLGEVVNR